MPTRLTGFDVAKGLAMIFVVFGHVWRGLNDASLIPSTALFRAVDQAVYLFHMPVFFFLSGLFFSTTFAPLRFLKSRLTLLLWPMLLWCWIDALLRLLVGTQSAPETLAAALMAPFPPQGVYWFLLALFLLNLAAFAISTLPRPVRIAVIVGLSLAATLGRIDVSPFDSLWPTVIHLPEFLLATLLANPAQRALFLGPNRILPGLALFAIGQTLLLTGMTHQLLIWHEVAIWASMLGFILVTANLKSASVAPLARIGRLTMPIYLTHVLFTAATRMALIAAGVTHLPTHVIAGTILGLIGPLVLLKLTDHLQISAYAGFRPPPKPMPTALPLAAPCQANPSRA